MFITGHTQDGYSVTINEEHIESVHDERNYAHVRMVSGKEYVFTQMNSNQLLTKIEEDRVFRRVFNLQK